MRLLLDTNIVLRTVNQDDVLYPLVSGAVHRLSTLRHELVVVPQVIYKFWSTASRPTHVNGLGWPLPTVRAVVDDLLREWTLLEDTPEVFDRWLSIVTTHEVKGKQVHDARLADAAQVHGIDQMLTLNVPDFNRFDLKSLHPKDAPA